MDVSGFLTDSLRDFSSVLGTALSVVGIFITFRQTKKARTAAEMAEKAANSARNEAISTAKRVIDRVSQRFSIEEISRLTHYIDKLIDGIQRGNDGLSEVYAEASMRSLSALRRAEVLALTDAAAQIAENLDRLAAIQTVLDLRKTGETKVFPKTAAKDLRIFITVLEGWKSDLRSKHDVEDLK